MTQKKIYTTPIIEDMECMVERGFTVSEPSAYFNDYVEEDLPW